MKFEQIATGGCQSYLIGCAETCVAAVIDPEVRQIDRYLGIAAREALRIHYVIDTHTHADHFSGTDELAKSLNVPVVMHRDSPAPFASLRLDDGDLLMLGKLRLKAIYTPGHTRDSMCLRVEDRLFTGDTLLIGATGRTDLPTGDAEALYDSLFHKVLKLDPALNVHPAHDYKGGSRSTIAQEIATNPRLQKTDRGEFVEMMNGLNLSAPTHLTEALRTNMNGGKTVAQLRAGRVVNCTGPGGDFDKIAVPLIADLRERNLAMPDPLGVGLETEDCAVLDAHGKPSRTLFALGPLTRPTWWEITAVPEINLQIDRLVAQLASDAPAPRLTTADFMDMGEGI